MQATSRPESPGPGNYNGEAGAELSRKGLSANYVERETRRAVAGVGDAVKIWPSIDIDIPHWPRGKENRTCAMRCERRLAEARTA